LKEDGRIFSKNRVGDFETMGFANGDGKDTIVVGSDDLGIANRGAIEVGTGARSFGVE